MATGVDLTRNILFRNFLLNDSSIRDNIVPGPGSHTGAYGSIVESMDISDVDIVQFLDKRALQDGMDAGDVYKGGRRIRVAGTLFGVDRGDLFDRLDNMSAALDPVLSQGDSPIDKGYQPFEWAKPTNRVSDYNDGVIELMLNAMPHTLNAPILRSEQSGKDDYGLALPWTAVLICKDPTITALTAQDYALTSASNTGNTVHRGNYPSVLNALIVVDTAAGSMSWQVGDSTFTITIPSSTFNRTIRLKGYDNVLTVEENGVESPNSGLISFSGDNTWPKIPTGTNGYSVSYTGVTPQAGSHMWFYEAYA